MSEPTFPPTHRGQRAIIGTSHGALEITGDAPLPELSGDTVVVRNRAISVNPVDTKMIGPYMTPGAIAGWDFAGDIVAISPDLGDTDFRIGDRVCGVVMGMNPLQPFVGAFATFVGASATGLLRIPPGMDYTEAATIGTAFMTSGLALFHTMRLPGDPTQPTTETNKYVLVSGGSSATGTAALQLLRLAGFVPIATASPRNFELVQSYGAAAVFDYNAPDCAAKIRALTRNNLHYALDCITTGESTTLCYAALGRGGGVYTSLDPFSEAVAKTRKAVKADWVLGPTMMGLEVAWPEPHRRDVEPDTRKFGLRWREVIENLLEQGKIRTHPINVQGGGLQGALDGLEEVKKGLVRAEKLVFVV